MSRWLASSLLVCSACSLLVDLDGFSGGAGADAGTAAAADAAAADAADAGGDAAGTPCVPGPGVLCDAFDDTPLGARWSGKSEVAGTVTLDGTVGLSPPNALRASVNGDGEAYLYALLPNLPTHVRCELDMNLGSPPAGEIDVLSFLTSGGSSQYQLYVLHNASGWLLAEFGSLGGSVDRSAPIANMPIGRWVHAVFETDGSNVSLSLDGTVAATLGSVRAPAGIDRRICVGISYVAKALTYAVLYDNVACTYGP